MSLWLGKLSLWQVYGRDKTCSFCFMYLFILFQKGILEKQATSFSHGRGKVPCSSLQHEQFDFSYNIILHSTLSFMLKRVHAKPMYNKQSGQERGRKTQDMKEGSGLKIMYLSYFVDSRLPQAFKVLDKWGQAIVKVHFISLSKQNSSECLA